jgi:hypothetical protein
VWVLALWWAAGIAAPARAQDPAPAVDVTVVGTAGDLERVRALVPRLSAGGARWLRLDRLDPADVLRDRRDGEVAAAVRAWIDVTSATRARLYFAIRAGNRPGSSPGPAIDRFLVRDVDLSGRFDEVDRAALAEVLESSIGALVANERAGLTRAEAEAVLARREAPAPLPALTAPPAPPPQTPPAPPPPRWAIGFFYAAQALGDEAAIDHGPGIALAVAATGKFADVHDAGRGPVVFASAQYRLPVHERSPGIGVALYTVAARAGVECGPLLWSRLRVHLGAGADFVHVSPESSNSVAVLTPTHWSTSFVATAAFRANVLRQARRFWLSAMLFADVLPTAVRYDAAIDGAATRVFSPWRVRPGLNLELTFY